MIGVIWCFFWCIHSFLSWLQLFSQLLYPIMKIFFIWLTHSSRKVCLLWIIDHLYFQENPATLQAILSGEINIASSHQQGHRDRALALLHQVIEDAHMGKRQFLSGKIFYAKILCLKIPGSTFILYLVDNIINDSWAYAYAVVLGSLISPLCLGYYRCLSDSWLSYVVVLKFYMWNSG